MIFLFAININRYIVIRCPHNVLFPFKSVDILTRTYVDSLINQVTFKETVKKINLILILKKVKVTDLSKY